MRESQTILQFNIIEVSPENCEEEPMSETWSETLVQNIFLYIAELVVERPCYDF